MSRIERWTALFNDREAPSLPRRRRAVQAVVDRLAETGARHRHDGDGRGAAGVEHAQVGEQIGGGLDQIAAWREVEPARYALGALDRLGTEGEQRFVRVNARGIEPQPRARRI